MTANAVIDGSFADFKLVKTRSVAQVVIEIPIERAEELVAKFGIPRPGQEIAVAIARLQAPPAEARQLDPDRSEVARRTYRNLPPRKRAVERAAMLCTDPLFGAWLSRKHSVPFPEHVDPVVIAANWMRRHLGVESRSQIGMDEAVYQKFLTLEATYRVDTGQMAEQRG